MSLITDSDVYSPSINDDGTYVDRTPCFDNHSQGFRCPCSNKSYTTRNLLSAHFRTGIHKNWIESLNANRTNYFAELEKERQVVHQQKIIIARMEQDIAKLQREKRKMLEMIHFISSVNNTSSQSEESPSQIDLIDFN